MDVELIQKVNKLALDLLNQGLARDREEATLQAERILQRSKGTEEYTQIRERMEQVNNYKEKVDDLSQDKIKEILEKNTTFIVTKFKEFQGKFESLEQEIATLKQQLRNQALNVPSASVVGSNSTVSSNNGSSAQVKPGEIFTKPAETKSHPRSGSYTDQDVSIEKYFYMGHK